MFSVTVNSGIVFIPTSDSVHSVVDRRCKRLSKLCSIYPPLDSFTPVSEDIFKYKFKSVDDFYFFVNIYATQMNFKLKVEYSSHLDKKITFKCSTEGCCFKASAYYDLSLKKIIISFHPHNHILSRRENTKIINILNDNILKEVDALVNNTRTTTTEIIKVIKQSYNINKKVEKDIERKIFLLRKDKRDEVNGFYLFMKEIKEKYTYYENKNTVVVILDKEKLYKFSTILCDGTFGLFINGRQLYLTYVQVSPKLLLLVAFSITTRKDKETYRFIYSKLNHNGNIINCIHDKESAVVAVLKEIGIKFVYDTYHMCVYIRDKKLKNLLLKYIKNPDQRCEIYDNLNPKHKIYFNKDGINSFGIFGSHSTSAVEGLNNIIKKSVKSKRSTYFTVLKKLEEIYTKQLNKIKEIISINNINNSMYTTLLWPECAANMIKQLEYLVLDKYIIIDTTIEKTTIEETITEEATDEYTIDEYTSFEYTTQKNIYNITVENNAIYCSCGYREITGIPCRHIIYCNLALGLNYNIKDLICNEAYKSFFLSNTKITPYNNDFNYPSDILDALDNLDETKDDPDDKENDSSEVIIDEKEFTKIYRKIDKIYKTSMLKELKQDTVDVVYSLLLPFLYKDINENDFISFTSNRYDDVSDESIKKIITYIYILISKMPHGYLVIDADDILNYINTELFRSLTVIPQRIRSPKEKLLLNNTNTNPNEVLFKEFIKFCDELTETVFTKIINILDIRDIMSPYCLYTSSKLNMYKYKYIPICYNNHWSLIYNTNKKLVHYDSTGYHINNNKLYNKLNINKKDITPYNCLCQHLNYTCGYFVIYFITELNSKGYITILEDLEMLNYIINSITKLFDDDEDRIISIINEEYY